MKEKQRGRNDDEELSSPARELGIGDKKREALRVFFFYKECFDLRQSVAERKKEISSDNAHLFLADFTQFNSFSSLLFFLVSKAFVD
jgi:hypothetical protein